MRHRHVRDDADAELMTHLVIEFGIRVVVARSDLPEQFRRKLAGPARAGGGLWTTVASQAQSSILLPDARTSSPAPAAMVTCGHNRFYMRPVSGAAPGSACQRRSLRPVNQGRPDQHDENQVVLATEFGAFWQADRCTSDSRPNRTRKGTRGSRPTRRWPSRLPGRLRRS